MFREWVTTVQSSSLEIEVQSDDIKLAVMRTPVWIHTDQHQDVNTCSIK